MEDDSNLYIYDLPDIEPGRCFFDDKNRHYMAFYRFNSKTFMIGDYSCDMVQIFEKRISYTRDVRMNDLMSMKEMEPEQFERLEKLAMESIEAVNNMAEGIKSDLKLRHSRLIHKK